MAYKECNAKSKRTGKKCRARAMANGKCYHHGGAHKRGLEHHNTKTGKYSKHMPTRYAARHEELMQQQDLLDMREDVALLTERLQELSGRMDIGDYGSSYKKLQALYTRAKSQFQDGMSGNNPQAMMNFVDYFNEIGLVIERGASDYNTWQEISQFVDERGKVIDRISKVEYRGQQAITLESLMMLMGKLAEHFMRVNSIDDEVERRKAFLSGQDDLIRLVG